MNTALYWTLLVLYIIISLIGYIFLGVAIKKKYVNVKRGAISVLFGAQFILFSLIFKMALYANVILNIFSLFAFFFGIRMQVIGLTGGIASGKSTVSNMLKQEGFEIIDADQISRDLRFKDKNYQALLIKTFGQ